MSHYQMKFDLDFQSNLKYLVMAMKYYYHCLYLTGSKYFVQFVSHYLMMFDLKFLSNLKCLVMAMKYYYQCLY